MIKRDLISASSCNNENDVNYSEVVDDHARVQ